MMKNPLIILLVSVLAFCLPGCRDDEDCVVPEYTPVRFYLDGDVVDDYPGIETDMSVCPDRLFGFQIRYYDSENPVAYGLFDDLSRAEIQLRKGEQYYVLCSLVPEGKQVCQSPEGEYNGVFGHYSDVPLELNRWFFWDWDGFPIDQIDMRSFNYKVYKGHGIFKAGDERAGRILLYRKFGYLHIVVKNIPADKRVKVELRDRYNYLSSVKLDAAHSEVSSIFSMRRGESWPFVPTPHKWRWYPYPNTSYCDVYMNDGTSAVYEESVPVTVDEQTEIVCDMDDRR